MTVSKMPKPKPPVPTPAEKARVIDLRNEQTGTRMAQGTVGAPKPKPAEKKATITLDAANSDREFPAYQLSINAMDGENSGHGYRLMGPKYAGRSRNLRTAELDQRDADSIRGILDEVFPPTSERHLEDGSTHTVQSLTDAGEACVQQECTAAREEKRLRQEQYSLRAQIEGVLDEVGYMADNGRITPEVAAELRKSLRDALGLNKPIS